MSVFVNMPYLFFRREAPAEDVPRPVRLGSDVEADGDPNVPAQGQPQIANHASAFTRHCR